MEYIEHKIDSWNKEYGQIRISGPDNTKAQEIFKDFFGKTFDLETFKGNFKGVNFNTNEPSLRFSCMSFFKNLDEGNIIYMYVKDNNTILITDKEPNLQKIYFGTPGSGKSYKVNEFVREIVGVDDKNCTRVIFHPDTDYASFVGSYKPITEEKEITYEFVPQAFTNAYIKAWKNLEQIHFLVIEEINRGNCAQIFGDLFQLLDREYSVDVDTDLSKYLKAELGENNNGIKNDKLELPPNLYILATMNTSDQSLFPMDSAFKRRWDWEYVPINYNAPSKEFTITIGESKYNWHEFLKAINEKIKLVTESEDKQMGNFFIKSSIEEKEFKSKVMFYLWSEICKEEFGTQNKNNFFRYKTEGTEETKEFSFNELYDDEKVGTEILKKFFEYLPIKPKPL